jgi:hypothetical protein
VDSFVPLTSDSDQLQRLKRMVDDALKDPDQNRIQQQTDRDYYDGNQLSPEMRQVLRARKQPEIVRNHIKNAVNGVVGVVDSNRVDPRAYPREPQDEDAADVASDVLRYTADVNHFSSIKADCLENGLIEGCYAVIVEGGPDQDPSITQIRWEEFIYDPRSRRPDFKDAKYLGVAKWMYADEVARTYGIDDDRQLIDAASASDVAAGLGAADVTYEDRPVGVDTWVDEGLRRVLVCELYWVEKGQWSRAVFCAAGVLEPVAVSAYQDDRGNTKCPIIAQSAYVDRRNNRYGIVRDMRGPQDGVNMTASRALHAANSRQVQQKDLNAPAVDVQIVREEAAKPDGVLPMGWEAIPQRELAAANIQFMQELKDEIQRMSPNPALIGRGTADASGRAVQIRQQAGLVELARVLGRFNDWENRVYRGLWANVRQFWRAPKWVRTIGDEGAFNHVQVNEIVSPGVPAVGPTGQPITDPQTGQPQWAQPPQIKNHVAQMDVDIVIDTTPDTPNLQQEVWQELTRLIGTNPAYASQVPFSLAIEMSPLPRKRELLSKLETVQQQQAPAQAQAQQLQTAGATAKVNETNAKANLLNAQAGHAQATTRLDAIAAHTDLADHVAGIHAGVEDTAVQKAGVALEVKRLEQEARQHGPYSPANAPPA